MLANIERPKTFDDVIGQDSAVKALKNAFKSNTLGNVIFLIGNSGTGKNTLANIIASTLVCEHPVKDDKGNVKPCCECSSCRDVMEEKYQKVMVYSGANLTADELKNLEDQLQYNPGVFVANRVIIINEAQQSSVLRRLLEVIETPRKNTYFILTSTDKAKFSNQGGKSNKEQETQALRSRGTYLNLKSISSQQISEYLFGLIDKYNLTVPDSFIEEGLFIISENANGNIRLAINDFSTAINAEAYTESVLVELLGYTNTQEFTQILLEICNNRPNILSRLKDIEDLYGWFQYSWKVLTEIQIRTLLGKPFDEEWRENNYKQFKNTTNYKDIYKIFGEISRESTGLYNGAFTNFLMFKLVNFFNQTPIGVLKKVKTVPQS